MEEPRRRRGDVAISALTQIYTDKIAPLPRGERGRVRGDLKPIFLDRDGVINKDPLGGYITRPEDFKFLPGSLEALKKLSGAGYDIFIISNQAGVAKGLFTLKDLKKVNDYMMAELEKAGVRIRSVNYCPHRDEDNCVCRKPKPGLFKKAAKGLKIDFSKTYFIGDGTMDIQAGKAVGCKTILLLSGKTSLDTRASWPTEPDYIMKDLAEAVEFVLSKG